MTRLVAALVAAASLAAVLAVPAGAVTTRRYAVPETGATIAIPSSWRVLERRTVTNTDAFRRFVDENPALGTFAAQMSAPTSPVKLMAFDLPATGAFVTNVNIVLAGPAGGITPQRAAAVYGRELKAQLRTVLGPVTTSVVRLPAGPAIRASYRARYVYNGRAASVRALQYLVLRRDRSVIVTFTTTPAEAARRSAAFTTIARSLRFGA